MTHRSPLNTMPYVTRTLLLPLSALLFAGCGRVAMPADGTRGFVTAEAHYPVRADLLATGNLGAPPRWHAAGYPPLHSLRVHPRTPDIEFADKLRPLLGKDIFDPVRGLTDAQRDDLGRLLDDAFGTPAAPTVKVPTAEEAAKLNIGEYLGKKESPADLLAAAARAKDTLGLTDPALARGGVAYRRWCAHCHGETGAGDGAHAVQLVAMPRDYRQGVFKYVTTSPTAAQTKKGERGKALKDDLKRTVRNGLDGSMMPSFPQLTDAVLDDLAGYVIHLAVRGETEFEAMVKAMKPSDDDPEFVGKELERMYVAKLVSVLANWDKAQKSAIPIPPECCPTESARLESALRGFKAYQEAGCIGCHVNYGRDPQLKYDLWGTVVQPRNLVLGVYRGGRRGEDLYARIYGGIYPSGMNEHKQFAAATPPNSGKPDKLWDIVHFVQAVADPAQRRRLQELDSAIKIDP